MKHLENYKEEIHKCSKCGLCQSVCPVYQITGNDCTVSRGQFIMLDGVLKGELKLNRKINKYLDMCLKCGKCKEFCPTEIDVVQILMSAKYEYFKRSFRGKIYKLLESKLVFNSFLKIVETLTGIFHKKPVQQLEHTTKKAIYFGGCVEKFRPSVRNYVVELLNKMKIEVLEIPFNCCGVAFLTTGNLDRFVEQVKENVEKIKDLEFDYFVTDCASCQSTWRTYIDYLEDEELKQRLEKIEFKSIYELIATSGLEFSAKDKKLVTYHKPCHENSFESIKTILENCKNIEYKELEGYDECCGFGGIEHPWSLKTVYKILKKKSENLDKIKPDYVLTSCVGCEVSMSISTRFKTRAKRLISFLKDETKINP